VKGFREVAILDEIYYTFVKKLDDIVNIPTYCYYVSCSGESPDKKCRSIPFENISRHYKIYPIL